MGIRTLNVFMRMKRLLFIVSVFSLLMVGCSNNPDLGGNGGNNGGDNGSGNAGGNVVLGADGITISMPGWDKTRAYSRYELTTPELSVGEEVFVLDEDGGRHVFYVVDEQSVDYSDNNNFSDNTPDEGDTNDSTDEESNGSIFPLGVGGEDNAVDEDGNGESEEPETEEPETEEPETEEPKPDGFEISDYGENRLYVLKNPNVELVEGKRYRIQYPNPQIGEMDYVICLSFGDYDSQSLDWMVSSWQEFNSSKPCHFDLKRINCALVFDVVAPFDAHIEEMRLVCEDSAMFCIKGAFDGRPDDLYPERTTWASQLLFPYKNETWKQGEHYSFIITLWPYEFGTQEYTFEIYTSDDRSAIVPISIPNMLGGQIVEYQIGESEFEVAPLSYKDVIVADREGYEITGSYVTDGNGFVN